LPGSTERHGYRQDDQIHLAAEQNIPPWDAVRPRLAFSALRGNPYF
jgi:hypothetical protein